MVCFLKLRDCGKAAFVEKRKTKYNYRINNHKSKREMFRIGNRKDFLVKIFVG